MGQEQPSIALEIYTALASMNEAVAMVSCTGAVRTLPSRLDDDEAVGDAAYRKPPRVNLA